MAGAQLWRLARIATRGKLRSAEVAAFMLDPAPRLAELTEELFEGSYQPGKAKPFMVREPKRLCWLLVRSARHRCVIRGASESRAASKCVINRVMTYRYHRPPAPRE